jgi:hypothetical protein
MKSRTRRILLVPALAAFVLGLASAAHAGPAAAPALVDEEDVAYSAPEVGLRECDGGAQQSVHMRANDTPTTIGENGAYVPLAGSAMAFNVANGDSVLVDVTFTAEAGLVGEQIPNLPPADAMLVQIELDGAVMHPVNDPVFASYTYSAHALQACKRVGPGNHVVRVVWQVVDQGMANNVTGVMDDWEHKLQLHN